MYQSTGKIKLIADLQTFGSGFTKREFVITTSAERFPQDIKFETVKDKTAMLDQFAVGQEVTVSFDVRGNEYNGKYYVNLSCWRIEAAGAAAPAGGGPAGTAFDSGAVDAEPSADDLRGPVAEDDIPF